MKVICVPKDKLALHRLDYNLSESEDLIEVCLDNHTLMKLFEANFFQKINEKANSNIDDFEDENIVGEKELREVLDSDIFRDNNYDIHLQEIIYKIEHLFRYALNKGTGVFFYF
jgi:hypothetical protein